MCQDWSHLPYRREPKTRAFYFERDQRLADLKNRVQTNAGDGEHDSWGEVPTQQGQGHNAPKQSAFPTQSPLPAQFPLPTQSPDISTLKS
jgi:hypothetical protein